MSTETQTMFQPKNVWTPPSSPSPINSLKAEPKDPWTPPPSPPADSHDAEPKDNKKRYQSPPLHLPTVDPYWGHHHLFPARTRPNPGHELTERELAICKRKRIDPNQMIKLQVRPATMGDSGVTMAVVYRLQAAITAATNRIDAGEHISLFEATFKYGGVGGRSVKLSADMWHQILLKVHPTHHEWFNERWTKYCRLGESRPADCSSCAQERGTEVAAWVGSGAWDGQEWRELAAEMDGERNVENKERWDVRRWRMEDESAKGFDDDEVWFRE